MRKSLRSVAVLFALSVFAAAFATGCGGGGGGAPAVAPASTGIGRVSADVRLKGPSGAARAVFQSGEVITIDISITGYYAEDDSEFPPVTAQAELSGASSVSISVLDVPIGYNHILTAIATYPDDSTETVKCIIPAVTEAGTTTATADERTTVIAEAAVVIALDKGMLLSDFEPADLEQLSDLVDQMAYNSGLSYSELTGEGVLEYIQTEDVIDSVEIWPATATVLVGDEYQFTGHAMNQYGEFVEASYTFEVNGGIGTIDDFGNFIATTGGDGSIKVTASAPMIMDYTAVRSAAVLEPITAVAMVTVTACFDNFDCDDADMGTFDECISGGTAAAYCSNIVYPYVSAPSLGAVTFGEPVDVSFTASGGTPPYDYMITYGMLPPGWTFDPTTGNLFGEVPQYVSSWGINVGVSDSAGLVSDPMMDGVVSFTLSVDTELANLLNALQIADGALSEIMDLLNQMYTLTVAESSMHDTMNDTNYQTLLAQIDSVVSSASYDGSLLLDGTFASSPIEAPLTGPIPGYTIGTIIDETSTFALGLSGSSIISSSVATGNMTRLQSAMTQVGQIRAEVGAVSNIVDMAALSLDIMTMHQPSGDCLEDLYQTASISDGVFGDVTNALTEMYNLAVMANSNTISTDQLAGMQAEIDAYVDYLDHIELVINFAGNMLFDGALSETCPDAGAPTLANPQINAAALWVDTVDLTNDSAKAVIDTDGAITTVNGYRTTLNDTITTLQTMGVGGGAVGRVLN